MAREIFWDIPIVSYKEKFNEYRVFEETAYPMTNDQLSEFYDVEKPKGNPHPASSDLVYSILLGAYRLEDIEGKNSLRKFLKQELQRWPSTTSRVLYSPSGENEVVHNCGTSDEYRLKESKLVGPSCLIKDSYNSVLKTVLGTDNIHEINEVFNWINSTNLSLWRRNSNHSERDERTICLEIDSKGAYLQLDINPIRKHPAFLVLKLD